MSDAVTQHLDRASERLREEHRRAAASARNLGIILIAVAVFYSGVSAWLVSALPFP